MKKALEMYRGYLGDNHPTILNLQRELQMAATGGYGGEATAASPPAGLAVEEGVEHPEDDQGMQSFCDGLSKIGVGLALTPSGTLS